LNIKDNKGCITEFSSQSKISIHQKPGQNNPDSDQLINYSIQTKWLNENKYHL